MTDNQPGALGVQVDYCPRVNYALEQNGIPVVRSVRLENRSVAPLKEVKLTITAEPPFIQPWEQRIESVAAGTTHEVNPVALQLSPGFLGALTERTKGQLCCRVTSEEREVACTWHPVDLLTSQDWPGLSLLPEILAAFVLPNHPVVAELLAEAAQVLKTRTGESALSGYQTGDPRRVIAAMEAIYTVLQRRKLGYIVPPASYESEGQKIRFPDTIMQGRMGTCLDLALLVCGCLEQAGLNSLVVLVQGHAFAGAWLNPETFADAAVTEPLSLRKRVDLQEIVVFETTTLTADSSVDFAPAATVGRRHLEDPDRFLAAIDVKRARAGGIRPLPLMVPRPASAPAGIVGVTDRDLQVSTSDLLPPGLEEGGDVAATDVPETAGSRLDRWRRKLLDLSLRNRLLNFQASKKTVPVQCADASAMEDALAEGAAFKLLSQPKELSSPSRRDATQALTPEGESVARNLLRQEMKAGRLYTGLTQADHDKRLVEIYRAGRLGMEEGGASALYLAIGMLHWYETEQSQVRRQAPILLLPVDLQRKSVHEGYRFGLADAEARVNMTLLEMLRQDKGINIAGLDPLPEDQSGLDVSRILRLFREAVKNQPRWDVVEEVWIGIFSFAKFLMWKDLTDRVEELQKSPIVDHLVNHPNDPFEPGAPFPAEDRLDEERQPSQTFCPLPADASQLAAVFAAAEGRTFVLNGPPGTGKSQTIANLISHCLAEGKTVLFVSEKMAALEVVYRRLRATGVAEFCLELHSNKAQKRQVLAQLEQTLKLQRTRTPEEWTRDASRLSELRRQLNEYVEELHTRHANGLSVFQALGKMIALRETPKVALAWPTPDALDVDALGRLRDLMRATQVAAGELGDITRHPWRAVGRASHDPLWQDQVEGAAAGLRESASILQGKVEAAGTLCHAGGARSSKSELGVLDELATTILAAMEIPTALAREDFNEVKSGLAEWIRHGRKRDELRARLYPSYQTALLTLDLDLLQQTLLAANAAWAFPRWWKRRAVARAFRAVSVRRQAPAIGDLQPLIESSIELRAEEQALQSAGEQARRLLGRYWHEGEAKWDEIEQLASLAGSLDQIARRIVLPTGAVRTQLCEHWASLTGNLDPAQTGVLREFRDAHRDFEACRKSIIALLELDEAGAWGTATEASLLPRTIQVVDAWLAAADRLRTWCSWQRVRQQGVEASLEPLMKSFERSEFSPGQFLNVFDRSYTQWWYNLVVSGSAALRRFVSSQHELTIGEFRALDKRCLNLSREFIAARLAARIPVAEGREMPESQMGILRREIGKKTRHLSVRRLFQTIPQVLPRLKPCLLMSPMSVAQYLDAGYPPFDLVVFDEASQMPVWDGVGALGRGRQAVVVGDPKQLPPTSFFERADDEEEVDEAEVVQDLESVLDDCLAAGLQERSLHWHYRSRHEGLIAFSNHQYYRNELLTFPAPSSIDTGVRWCEVKGGVYDRGRSRTNKAEALAVVDEIHRRSKDERLRTRSIGVVALSQAQQTLIENLCDARRQEDLAFDTFMSGDGGELPFIKNLENVQGDERDVILISIGYGPDATGKVAMNFGPLNRDGGERRLNVAVTRARMECLVFSTLRAEQIDLSRARAKGIEHLRNFLQYADKGASALAATVQGGDGGECESPFEVAVYDALTGRGWTVNRQVGCARYRIDLGVVDPRLPGRYLLGVECDGANYHRAKTARDRDKLREEVLRNLGWSLHRVWSTDWWLDPAKEAQKVEDHLQELLRTPPDASPAAGSNRPAPPAPTQTAGLRPLASSLTSPAKPNRDAQTASRDATPRSEVQATGAIRREYQAYRGPARADLKEVFYDERATSSLERLLESIVDAEGPISMRLLARRAMTACGFVQTSAKGTAHLRSLLDNCPVRLVVQDGEEFFWPKSIDPAGYRIFRTPDLDSTGRAAEDIPRREVENALLYLLERHISAPITNLSEEASRLFGVRRTNREMEINIRLAIQSIVKSGAAVRSDSSLRLQG